MPLFPQGRAGKWVRAPLSLMSLFQWIQAKPQVTGLSDAPQPSWRIFEVNWRSGSSRAALSKEVCSFQAASPPKSRSGNCRCGFKACELQRMLWHSLYIFVFCRGMERESVLAQSNWNPLPVYQACSERGEPNARVWQDRGRDCTLQRLAQPFSQCHVFRREDLQGCGQWPMGGKGLPRQTG